jgi:hypothetical protein
VQQRTAGPLDVARAVIAGAVVDEDRALEKAERTQFAEQRRQRGRFV